VSESTNAELVEAAREYAEAVDKDRGFTTGLTDTMRALAERLEQFDALRSACDRAWSYGSTTLKGEDYYAIQRILDGEGPAEVEK
jgi:uncharacterized protein YkwD